MNDIACLEDPRAPYRICCGTRHWGSVCPDGGVMCQLCFGHITQDKLHVLPTGLKEDICQDCYNKEHNL